MSPDPRSPDLLSAIASGAESLDRGVRGPRAEVQLLREHGWLSAALPMACGGQAWGCGKAGARDGFAALFLLGAVSLPMTRLFEGHLNAVRLIDQHGTPAQRQRLFSAVRDGALLAIWGADGDHPATIAPGGILRGTKTFASGLGEVAQAIVTASDDQGACQMVIVAADDPARWKVSAWDVAAMVGTCSGEFAVDQLAATSDCRLGEPGALFQEPDFNGGVWRLCAAYAGAIAAIGQGAGDHAAALGRSEDPRTRLRLGHIAHHAQTALLWAWHACRAVEAPVRPLGSTERAIAATLFAREAIDHAAGQQLGLVERIAGTSMHRRGSALGRQVRDLRFFLRQAGLDAKLDAALSLTPSDPRALLDDLMDDDVWSVMRLVSTTATEPILAQRKE